MLLESVHAYLAPYVLGLKLLGLALVFAAGMAGGCRWNKSARVEAETKQAEAETDRDAWRTEAETFDRAIKAQNTASEAARAADAKAKDELKQAVARANVAADRFLRRSIELEKQAEADRSEACNEIARMRVCGSPLL